MSNVASVSNYFATANEGFITTLSGTVLAGASIVPFQTVTNLTNGSIFVGIVGPGTAGEQVFTGTVDTSGSRITGVIWTKGTNTDHSTGTSVVDYVTGTMFNMLSKGMQVAHNQNGTIKTGAVLTSPKLITSLNDTNNNELFKVTATASAVNELTVANAATGGKPTLSATGSDTNIHINLVPKGTGEVQTSGIGPTRHDWARMVQGLIPSSRVSGTWNGLGTGSGWSQAAWLNQSSTPAIGDELQYKLWLEAGTYTLKTNYVNSPNYGIVEWKIDGANALSTDCYNAGGVEVATSRTGYAIVAPNTHVNFNYKITGKNASSSNYYMGILSIEIIRTA